MGERGRVAPSINGSWDYRAVILCILLCLLPLAFRFPLFGPLAPFIGNKLQPLEIAFVVLFPLYLLIAAKRGELRATLPAGWTFLLGFAAVCLVSSLLSIDPKKSLIDTAGFFYLFLLYVLLYKLLEDRRNVIISIRIFLVVSTLTAFFGLLAYWAYIIFGYQTFAVEVVNDFLGMKMVRVNSTFLTCNHLVVFLSFALAIALWFLGSREKRLYKILSVCLIVITCSFMLTGLYRGAFMIWGVLFFGTRDFVKTKWTRVLRGALLMLTIIFSLLFLFQGYLTLAPVKIAYDPGAERLGVSVSSQPSIYAQLHEAAVRVALDHPILGVGPGLYNIYMQKPEYGFDFTTHPFRGLDPHSTYLGYAAETGLAGLLFLVLFYWMILKRAGAAAEGGDEARRLRGLLRVYFYLMLVYAVFIDIVTIRFLYFAYALISVLADRTGKISGGGTSEVG
jgi:O-antigen ligase